jgi:Guanylylate cyclase
MLFERLHPSAASHLCPAAGLRSIWTVDLAHLLARFGLEVRFLTVTIGANPEFATESFYAENMPEDEQRVRRLFKVRGNGIVPSS